jgi:hypothetical protein
MIKKDLGLSSYEEVSCPFCETKVGYDEDGGSFGDCKHHIYHSCDMVDPVTEYEDLKIKDLFEGFDDENDFWFDFLEKKLDDSYLMIFYRSHGGGVYHIFHKN